jgi:hypothetical protein
MAADLKLDDLSEMATMDMNWADVVETTAPKAEVAAKINEASGIAKPETPTGSSSYPASPSLGGMKGPEKKARKIKDSDVPKTGPFVAAIKNIAYTLPPDDRKLELQCFSALSMTIFLFHKMMLVELLELRRVLWQGAR